MLAGLRWVRVGSGQFFGSVASVRFAVRLASVVLARFSSVLWFVSFRLWSVRFVSLRFGSVRFGSVRFVPLRFGVRPAGERGAGWEFAASARFGLSPFGLCRFAWFVFWVGDDGESWGGGVSMAQRAGAAARRQYYYRAQQGLMQGLMQETNVGRRSKHDALSIQLVYLELTFNLSLIDI